MDMDPHARIPPTRSDAWRAELPGQRSRRKRLMQRAIVTGLAIGLFSLFCFLLARPLTTPTTVWIGGYFDYSAQYPAALPMGSENLLALQSLFPSHDQGATRTASGPLEWNAESNLGSWETMLEPLASSDADVAIVYLYGQGAVLHGEAELLEGGFRPGEPEGSRLSLHGLLHQISNAPQRVKLLVLDAGEVALNTAAGITTSSFPDEVRRLVHATEDPNLWVLLSHSTGQSSTVSPVLRCSVFTHFVTRALGGDADADGDRILDIREVIEFVQPQVAQHVAQLSRNTQSQTPQLMCGVAKFESNPGHVPLVYLAHRANSLTELTASVGIGNITWSQIAKQLARNTSSDSPSPTPSPAPESTPPTTATSPNAQDAPSAGAAESTSQARLREQRQHMAQMLVRAWQLHDRVTHTAPTSIFASRSHQWRVFEQQLLGYEQRLRIGADESWQSIAWQLQTRLAQWSTLVDAEMSQPARDDPTSAPSMNPVAASTANTAAAERGTNTPKLTLDQAQAALAQYIASREATELRRWLLASWQPEFSADATLAWAHELAARDDIRDDLLRMSVELRWTADKIARDHANVFPWIMDSFEQGETHRLRAKQCLRDVLRSGHAVRAEAAMDEARRAFAEATSRAENIVDAQRLCAMLTGRAADYIRWFVNTSGSDSIWSPKYEELDALLREAAVLANVLDASAPETYDAVLQSAARLRTLRKRIELPLSPDALKHLVASQKASDHLREIEALLDTALLDCQTRITLLDAAERGRERYASRDFSDRAPRDSAQQLLLRTCQYLQLQNHLLALGVTPESPLGSEIVELRGKVDTLAAKHMQSASPGSTVMLDDIDQSSFADAVLQQSALYQKLVARTQELIELQDVSDSEAAAANLLELNRMIRVLDPRDVVTPLDQSLDVLRARLAAYREHAIQHRRARLTGVDLAETDRMAWLARCDAHRNQAMSIFATPNLPLAPVQQLEWEGPDDVSLRHVSSQEFTLQLKGLNRRSGPKWIFVDYDPQALHVEWTSPVPLYHANVVDGMLTGQAAASRRQESELEVPFLVRAWLLAASDVAPSLRDPVDEHVDLSFRVTRREGARGPVRLVLRALTENDIERHEIRLDLPGDPPIRIIAHAKDTPCASASFDGTHLHPWPNRPTEYSFAVRNDRPGPCKVNVWLHALPAGIAAASIAAKLEQAEPVGMLPDLGTEIAKAEGLTLPAAAEVPVPFSKFAAKMPLPKRAPEQPDPATAAADPAPVSLAGDLLGIVQDTDTGQTWYQAFSIAPQRPRNYVMAEVRYDARSRNVEAVVRARDAAWLPADGIPVQAHFADGDGVPVMSLAPAVLLAKSGEVHFQSSAPAAVGNSSKLYVDVDGYPRAFLFELSPNLTTNLVPEGLAQSSIRIVSPRPNEIFATPRDALDVALQVDVPLGAFGHAGNEAVVSLDAQRDRNEANDASITLKSDRRVETVLLETDPSGRFVCCSTVTDQQVRLPIVNVQDARVTVRASVQVGDLRSQAEPVDVVLDTRPPKILELQVENADMVARGHAAAVTVKASDEGLSGVARVEAAWDLEQTGKFPEQAGVAAGTHEPGVGWRLEVPAKELLLGKQTLLVRAIDRAGHRSSVATTEVTIVDPQVLDRIPVTVRGIVTYQGQPVADANVTIAQSDGTEIKPVKTAADGSFVILRVLPGKHSITAIIYVRNLPRQVTKQLIVGPVYERSKSITVAIP